MRESKGLKAQDVLVLLWLILNRDQKSVRLLDISLKLGISQAELALSFQRLTKSQLITHERQPIKAAAIEFLLYGLKYVFPAEPGPVTRGIPTAHSASIVADKLNISAKIDGYVWADPKGKSRGESISPLYKSVPTAASNDPRMHELLALIDAIRVGRAREANFASEELKKRIKEA